MCFWKRKHKRVNRKIKISSIKLHKKYTICDTYTFDYVPAANAYKYIYSNLELVNKSLSIEDQLAINFLASKDDMHIEFEIYGYQSVIDNFFNMLITKDINLIKNFKIER